MAGNGLVQTEICVTPAGGSKITFPVNPEKLQIGSNAKFMTYTTISLGEVKIHRGKVPLEVSWSGMFPGAARRNAPFVRNYTDPNVLIDTLQKARDSGTIVTLMVTGTKINGQYYVSEFKGKYSGGYGDFDYDIKFIEYREIKIYTTKELSGSKTQTTNPRKPAKDTKSTNTKSKTSTYTVRSGDSLWKIAQRKLGKGSRYTEIYKLNKNVIEKAAKKHGYKSSGKGNRIWAGTKLTIPKK